MQQRTSVDRIAFGLVMLVGFAMCIYLNSAIGYALIGDSNAITAELDGPLAYLMGLIMLAVGVWALAGKKRV
jgi:hypothetical protein